MEYYNSLIRGDDKFVPDQLSILPQNKCIYMFIILVFVTVNIITDLFILYLVLLIGLRRYMLFQSYRDFLCLKL